MTTPDGDPVAYVFTKITAAEVTAYYNAEIKRCEQEILAAEADIVKSRAAGINANERARDIINLNKRYINGLQNRLA